MMRLVKYLVVEEDVQHEARAPNPAARRRAARQPAAAAGPRRIEQEDQRQREQQVRAAEDHGLGRAEAGDVHVVERHRHRDARRPATSAP